MDDCAVAARGSVRRGFIADEEVPKRKDRLTPSPPRRFGARSVVRPCADRTAPSFLVLLLVRYLGVSRSAVACPSSRVCPVPELRFEECESTDVTRAEASS